MALAYPFVGAPPVPSVVGPLTLLPKPFASDIKDKGFGTREETLEEEEEVDFGKNKGGGADKEGNDDDDEEAEDEKVPLGVVAVEESKVDEPNDRRELAMGILELNEDGGGGCNKRFVAKRFLVGEAGREMDEGVGGRSEDVDGDVNTDEEDNKK